MCIDHHTINTLRTLANQCADDNHESAGVKPDVLLALLDAFEERDALAAHVEALKTAGENAALEASSVSQASIEWSRVCDATPASSLALRDAIKLAKGWEGSANELELMACPKGARFFRDGAANHLRFKAGKLRKKAEGHQ